MADLSSALSSPPSPSPSTLPPGMAASRSDATASERSSKAENSEAQLLSTGGEQNSGSVLPYGRATHARR